MHFRLFPSLCILSAAGSVGAAHANLSPQHTLSADTVQHGDTLVANEREKTVKLGSALVVGARQNKVLNNAMGLNFLRPEQIRSIPTIMGEADLIKALQMQPGVSGGVEGTAGMYVRGGNNDQNLFLIDGNPIYQMNHLGGLFSAYNVETVRDVAFYKTAFPARYGGRLSSVVDVTTQSGDMEHYHGVFSIGLTSANFTIGGPIWKNRTSFQVGVRRSWLDLLAMPVLAIVNADNARNGEKYNFGYSFTDFNLNVLHRMGRWGTLNLIGYAGQDRIRVDSENWLPQDENTERNSKSVLRMRIRWGNVLGALKWQMPVRENLLHSLTASYTNYVANSSFGAEDITGIPSIPETYSNFYFNKQVGNAISDYSLRSQWTWTPASQYTVRFGAEGILHDFTPELSKSDGNNNIVKNVNSETQFWGQEFALYADGEWQWNEHLRGNVGLRWSDFNTKGQNYGRFEPRVSVNYVFSPSWSVKAGYARMVQFVQQVASSYISLPSDYWLPVTDRHAPLTSDQWSVGGYYTWRNRWNVSLEAWHKTMDGLLEYREGFGQLMSARSWNDKLTSGRGTATGIDLLIEKNFGSLAGFVGYGLMWTNRKFAELNRGEDFPAKYDNRHKFNVAMSWRANRRVELNASWTWMTGNLITLALQNYDYTPRTHSDVPAYPPGSRDEDQLAFIEQRNNYRLPAFHRLDLGINFYRFHKKGGQSIWNISIYNAYSHMNPMVVQRDVRDERRNGRQMMHFRSISLLPIIPSVTYTYRF